MKNIENNLPTSDPRHIFGTQNDYAQMLQMIWGFTISQEKKEPFVIRPVMDHS